MPLICTRIYADGAGQTHFEDSEIPIGSVIFAPPAPALDMSSPIEVSRCIFFRLPSGWVSDWHPTPRSQLRLVLEGEVEIEVTDGTVRRFGPGSIGHIDDLGSLGHKSSVVGSADYVGVFIQL
jgi:hypothetical protein